MIRLRNTVKVEGFDIGILRGIRIDLPVYFEYKKTLCGRFSKQRIFGGFF